MASAVTGCRPILNSGNNFLFLKSPVPQQLAFYRSDRQVPDCPLKFIATEQIFASSAYPSKKSMDWKNRFNFGDLKTSTLGFWGFGDTTRHLLAIFAPLRPKRMLVASAHAAEEEIRAAGAEKVSFEMMLENSQHLHCLVGINAANYHKIGAAELAMMPDGATIYNCGRATLIQPIKFSCFSLF
jgi:phosphoglycerate dehydrogenase-like enzyme